MINVNTARKDNFSRRNHLLVDIEILRKEELAQRRKLRIQQVRLQSKDIANKVLRDVQNEKTRRVQFNQTKQDNSFKKWQDRKIFEINLMYKENITRLGSGYRAAEAEPDPEKEISELFKKNSDVAKTRGKKAFDQLKTEQEVSRIQQETLAAQRDKVKKLEVLRSSLISSLPPPQNSRKAFQKSLGIDLKVASCCDESQQREYAEDLLEHSHMKDASPVIPALHMEEAVTERKSGRTNCQTSCKTISCLDHLVSYPVEVYDRSNPCTFTTRQPLTVRVERTSPESQTNAREAAEIEEKVESERKIKRDNDEEMKQKRGKKALAKEMVRRDFDRLVSRLDGLVREERLVRGSVPPQLPVDMFMDERRSALRAQRRQRNMDSAFEGVFHGNEGIDLKGTSSVEEDNHPLPLRVEQVDIPEQWWDVRQHLLQSPGTPPEKLNVGIYDKGTDSLSASDLVTKDRTRSSGLEEAGRGSDAFGYLETRREPCENLPEKDDVSTLPKEDPKDKTDAPARVLPMDTSAIEAPMDSNVDDHSKATIHEQDESENDGRSSDTRVRQENITKAEACTQTGDMVSHQESHPYAENSLCRKVTSSVITETEESCASSHSSVSAKIEEVRVVLRFNEVSPKDTSLEEEVHLLSATSHKQRKKRIDSWKKHKKMTMNDEEKTLIDVETPDATPVALDDEKKTEPSESSVDITTKPEKRKKRVKKDHQKTKPSPPLSTSDSSYLSTPSQEDISTDIKTKALLREIRTQRKRLEKWSGLKRHDDDDKTSAPLGTYVQKLLSMTRESVAELSVSDVSTPSIHLTSPRPDVAVPVDKREVNSRSERKHEEKSLVSMLKKVHQETTPVPIVTELLDEKVMLPKSREVKIDYPLKKKPLSPLKTVASANSMTEISLPSSSSSFDISSPQEVETSDSRPSPPFPPPPSPEYEQLSDLHTRRISQLGAKLMEVREVQKKLLSLSSSFESESQKSSSSSLSSSTKVGSTSSEKSSSKKSDDYESKKDGSQRKGWDLSDICLSTSEDSDGISFLGNMLLESLHITEAEGSSEKSQEEIVAKRRLGHKSGPPPTPLKGIRWSVLDYQIPHELSTITEVDSKMISTTSIMESRKEKDSVASFSSIKMKLPVDPIPKPKSPEIDHLERTGVQSPIETAISPKIATEKSSPTRSPVSEKSIPSADVVEQTPTIIDPAKITPEKTTSGAEVSSSSSSIEGDASYSSQFPGNLDEALRLLGISPTFFLGPQSPHLTEVKSPVPMETALAGDIAQQSTMMNDFSSPLIHSIVKTKVQGEDILEPVKDVELHDAEQASFPSGEIPHLMQSYSIRKSPFGSKDSQTPVHLLVHSTPVNSISTGTSSSSSGSHHKNLSDFPFMGDSAPSSISGSGTPFGAELRNIDEDEKGTKGMSF